MIQRVILVLALTFFLFGCDKNSDNNPIKNIVTVSGTVIDEQNNSLLSEAVVTIADKTTETDVEGVYSVEFLIEKILDLTSRKIKVSKEGYQLYERLIQIKKNSATTHDVKLRPLNPVATWDVSVLDQDVWE